MQTFVVLSVHPCTLRSIEISAARRLKPGGLCIATVPALSALKSVVDDLAGHKRRYEPGELSALLARSGLVAIEERGIFAALLPLMQLVRRRIIFKG